MDLSSVLRHAIIENAKSRVDFGISFEQLKSNKEYHNKIFFDKWGIPWKFIDGQIYFNERGYPRKRFKSDLWNKGHIEAIEFKVMKFFTREEFEKVKPEYL